MVFEKFTANGALEGKSIIRMVQDQEGFIWFGAVDGLYRYDGNQVKEFRYDEEDSTSLSDNYIRALHVSSSGDLWVGTWNQGLNKYDPEREAFIRFQYQSGKASGISANSIEDLFEDSYGRLWVCTGNAGLSLFNEKNETFQHFVGPAYMKNDSLWRVVEDRDQKLWIGHRDGVDVLDLNTFEKADLPLEFDQLRTYWVTALHEDTKGDIWLGTWRNGLYKWDKNQKRLDKVRYSDGEEIIGVKDFFDGSDDNLWIAAGNLGFGTQKKMKCWPINRLKMLTIKLKKSRTGPSCKIGKEKFGWPVGTASLDISQKGLFGIIPTVNYSRRNHFLMMLFCAYFQTKKRGICGLFGKMP
jgi:ligand-binding sensor domain-containing protein